MLTTCQDFENFSKTSKNFKYPATFKAFKVIDTFKTLHRIIE